MLPVFFFFSLDKLISSECTVLKIICTHVMTVKPISVNQTLLPLVRAWSFQIAHQDMWCWIYDSETDYK